MRGTISSSPECSATFRSQDRVDAFADGPQRMVLRNPLFQFDRLYARTGRPSVPPERLRRAVLLQIFYSIRSERMLMQQMNYNLLFHRLLNQEVAQEFFRRVLTQAKAHLSDEHFMVDGTLMDVWASQKSFQTKDGGEEDPGPFRGQKWNNETHQSKTEPQQKRQRAMSLGADKAYDTRDLWRRYGRWG